MMKKFVIVPEEKHRASLNAVKESNREILQSIQQPVQHEMLKRYQTAQGILRDDSKPLDRKMSEYHEAMNDFALLRDRGGHGLYFKQPRTVEKQHDALEKKKTNDDAAETMKPVKTQEEDDMDRVFLLPTKAQNNAKKLMKYLRDQGNVSWTREGEVSIDGEPLKGTNIIDLVDDVVNRTKPYSNPQLNPFLNAMARANIPETLVKNKTALENYRTIKNNTFTTLPMKGVLKEDQQEESSIESMPNWNAPL